jgi:phosphate transport system permease protein
MVGLIIRGAGMAENVLSNAAEVPRARNVFNSRAKLRKVLDALLYGVSACGAFGMIVLLLLLAVVLFMGALPAIKAFGLGFLLESEWDPVEMHFGAWPVIYGTIVSSLLALLLAVPVSIGAALFLTRLAPRWLALPISFLIELLAAIPSIAYGFWGVAVLVPFLQQTGQPFLKSKFGGIPILGTLFSGPPYGFSMLAAGIVLAIMVTPIITAVTRDVLNAVPKEIEEGAYALGATWWQASLVVLSYGKMGIFGAIILGFARAVGETMAVTMVIGNRNMVDLSLLAPGQTMASLLANEFQEADKPMYMHSLVYVALALLVLTVLFNAFARVLINRVKRGPRPIRPVKKAEAVESAAVVRTPVVSAAPQPAKLAAAPAPTVSRYNRNVRIVNKIFKSLCIGAAMLAIASLALILGYVIFKGFSSLSWDFFTKLPGPAGSPIGMRNAIVGTVILVALASLIGVPLGMLCGIYLSEYAKASWFNDVVRLVVDVLAGTPSIIVGVLAYELIVVPNGQFPGLGLGYSGWGGAMALAFLMCPIISRTTEEMLRLVPERYREASLSLGGAKYQTILKVVLPAASSGIITGIMLSIARVAGETAPLLFTALGNDSDVYNPNKPFPALTLTIFKYATSAEPEWIRQAWAGMLVLIVMILLLSAAVRYVTRDKIAVRV